jgi:hypothetical protein
VVLVQTKVERGRHALQSTQKEKERKIEKERKKDKERKKEIITLFWGKKDMT